MQMRRWSWLREMDGEEITASYKAECNTQVVMARREDDSDEEGNIYELSDPKRRQLLKW